MDSLSDPPNHLLSLPTTILLLHFCSYATASPLFSSVPPSLDTAYCTPTMRFATLTAFTTLLLGSAVCVLGQASDPSASFALKDLPPCFLKCSSQAATQAKCQSSADLQCICKSEEFVKFVSDKYRGQVLVIHVTC
jgi:hypothetical protein